MAENILDTICAVAAERVAQMKSYKSLASVRSDAEALGSDGAFPFKAALAQPGLAVIAELKKASPSKGLICPDFEQVYLKKAREYEAGGAAAISCLTEPKFFLGCDAFLAAAHQAVGLPVLRKDFTIDEYQIYEAKNIGASAVLLICSVLRDSRLGDYLALARELGLSALAEAHSEAEIERALAAGAEIIGVNNRNLKTFSVDTGNSLRLRQLVPQGTLFVAESGIASPQDTRALKAAGVDAVLVGEALMRAPDAAAFLRQIAEA